MKKEQILNWVLAKCLAENKALKESLLFVLDRTDQSLFSFCLKTMNQVVETDSRKYFELLQKLFEYADGGKESELSGLTIEELLEQLSGQEPPAPEE